MKTKEQQDLILIKKWMKSNGIFNYEDDLEFTYSVIRSYMPDCPGWCGDVYTVIFGSVGFYYVLGKNSEGELEEIEKEF